MKGPGGPRPGGVSAHLPPIVFYKRFQPRQGWTLGFVRKRPPAKSYYQSVSPSPFATDSRPTIIAHISRPNLIGPLTFPAPTALQNEGWWQPSSPIEPFRGTCFTTRPSAAFRPPQPQTAAFTPRQRPTLPAILSPFSNIIVSPTTTLRAGSFVPRAHFAKSSDVGRIGPLRPGHGAHTSRASFSRISHVVVYLRNNYRGGFGKSTADWAVVGGTAPGGKDEATSVCHRFHSTDHHVAPIVFSSIARHFRPSTMHEKLTCRSKFHRCPLVWPVPGVPLTPTKISLSPFATDS